MASTPTAAVKTAPYWVILTIVFLCFIAFDQSSAATVKNGDKFKDWSAGCQKIKDSEKLQCHIFQRLVQKKDDKFVPVMHVIVGYLTKDGKPALFITVPLGVSLAHGLQVRVDDGEPVPFRYSHCLTSGCVGGVEMSEALIAKMKAGKQAIVTIYSGAQQPLSIAVSLQGFTAGFDALR